VTSPWILPYNSGYEYGAAENAARVVLNGRFVGVEPLDGIDTDLLGGVLNSTFVMMARLLEGTAAGVEGALDVGPPAVRRMMIPDIRRLSDRDAAAIAEVVETMRSRNVMPPAPDRAARVDPLRQRLDTMLLRGIGCTKGEASAIVGQVYESYARWRSAVEPLPQLLRAVS
jgi:hypothetical protein